MSVRDTGWQDETFPVGDGESIGSWVRRIGEVAYLRVDADDAVWSICLPYEEALRGESSDLASAKRAAEEALRNLCRDTLAALGDTPPPA